MWRRLTFVTVALLLVLLAAAPVAADAYPDVIPLPDGFQPEGVAVGRGPTIYAGSLADGSIYAANLRTGLGGLVVPPQDGRIAVGLDFDNRSGLLWVAGGPGGAAYVYDPATGAEVASYALGTAPIFVNDVIVTRDAAYLTNSFAPVYYRIPIAPGGTPSGPAQTIPLGGDYTFIPGGFNGNGIVATADGRWLIVANTSEAALYRVDPATGDATRIDTGGPVPNGDGLVLVGHTLYVVQNFRNQIAVIRLDSDFDAGQVVRTITDPDFRIPTTADRFGSSLYAVNARFDTAPMPDTEYEIVRVPAN